MHYNRVGFIDLEQKTKAVDQNVHAIINAFNEGEN